MKVDNISKEQSLISKTLDWITPAQKKMKPNVNNPP